MSANPNIRALREEANPDSCLVCDLPLPLKQRKGGRRVEICGSVSCRRVRQRAYELDYLARRATR